MSNPLAHLIEQAHTHWQDRDIDPNLTAALDKLGEKFGPLGVAFAAACRTEPQALVELISATFHHQNELWDWLHSNRYTAELGTAGTWIVIDTDARTSNTTVVATIESAPAVSIDAEDAARAMADHLNGKIVAALVAQARLDFSSVHESAK